MSVFFPIVLIWLIVVCLVYYNHKYVKNKRLAKNDLDDDYETDYDEFIDIPKKIYIVIDKSTEVDTSLLADFVFNYNDLVEGNYVRKSNGKLDNNNITSSKPDQNNDKEDQTDPSYYENVKTFESNTETNEYHVDHEDDEFLEGVPDDNSVDFDDIEGNKF